jgi:hypothetical protein
MNKYITVATYNTPWEAHLARAKLESEGIYALILDEQTASINWFYSNTAGAVRLQVRKDESQRAIEILESTVEENGE